MPSLESMEFRSVGWLNIGRLLCVIYHVSKFIVVASIVKLHSNSIMKHTRQVRPNLRYISHKKEAIVFSPQPMQLFNFRPKN